MTRLEYFRELIQQDERRRAEQHLEELLLEGLQGDESELTKQDFEDIRNQGLALFEESNKKG